LPNIKKLSHFEQDHPLASLENVELETANLKSVNLENKLHSLSTLPCFTDITCVTEISGGLSNPCFKVEADKSYFFAKRTAEPFLNIEIYLTKITANEGLAPALIYHDDQWIISQFISGENLAQSKLTLKDKIAKSIELLVKFHQLAINTNVLDQTEKSRLPPPKKNQSLVIPTLDVHSTINELIDELTYEFTQADKSSEFSLKLASKLKNELATELSLIANRLNKLIAPLVQSIVQSSSTNIVCCHSDINFSNVLIDANQQLWLIDFEYACEAPAEFDIAMFMAINNIPLTLFDEVIGLYEDKADASIDKLLCNYYLAFSYLINGLWYVNQSQLKETSGSPDFIALTKEQWQSFDNLHEKLSLSLTNKKLSQLIS
jgi:thiamine kinase-like enzyme